MTESDSPFPLTHSVSHFGFLLIDAFALFLRVGPDKISASEGQRVVMEELTWEVG